jgi:hypothetical protein
MQNKVILGFRAYISVVFYPISSLQGTLVVRRYGYFTAFSRSYTKASASLLGMPLY